MFAIETARIGRPYSQSWPSPNHARIELSVPSLARKAYHKYPATTSGSTQARITTAPPNVRTTASERRIHRASARPSMFCPTMADTSVNTRVSTTALTNPWDPSALVKLSRPTKCEDAAPAPLSDVSVKAAYTDHRIGPTRNTSS